MKSNILSNSSKRASVARAGGQQPMLPCFSLCVIVEVLDAYREVDEVDDSDVESYYTNI